MPLKEVARFSVSYLQVLDEEGNFDESQDPGLGPADLVRLYRAMVLARAADQRMLKLQRQGRMGTFPPATGQEAAACGAALALRPTDWMVGAYRELGARLMRGEPIANGLLYHRGFEEGSSLPREQRTLPNQVIIASQLLHAVGIGYAIKYRGEQDVAVLTFCGDGATSQGDFYEALNFAGVWRAPVVFVVQNNGWAISMPRSRQTAAETLAQKAIAAGFPGIQVDGNDALAMYKATSEALARARRGEGPSLIEAITYRLLMHTTADDPRRYRTEEEEQGWEKRNPITRLRIFLERRDLWNEAREAELAGEVKQEVEAAVQQVESGFETRPDSSFDHVFGQPHPEIELQRAEFLKLIAEEGEEASHG